MSDTPQLPATTDKPWLQQPNEKMLWFDRFEVYRNIGPDRSLLSTYRLVRKAPLRDGQELSIPSSWSQAYHRYHWKERAEAFDKLELEKLSEELGERRQENRRKRIKLLDKAFEKVNQAIDSLEPSRMVNLADLTALLRLVITESRAEYEKSPDALSNAQTVTNQTIKVGPVLIDYRNAIAPLAPADYEIELPDEPEPDEVDIKDRLLLTGSDD